MKQTTFIFILIFAFLSNYAQAQKIDHLKIKEDLNEILSDIANSYAYLDEKKVDLECIRKHYNEQIPNIQTKVEVTLFFEYLLDELYDNHVTLSTNNNSSFRLFSPIYARIEEGKAIITNVWQGQVESLEQNIIGAELLEINKLDINTAIQQFPTHCSNKKTPEVREWIINKLIAGRYDQARILTLKLTSEAIIEFDLDQVKIKSNEEFLSINDKDEIGIIRINNSLGNNELIEEFDEALEGLMNTKGLIIDLRNTVDGGNSYVARGIMSRFISEPKAYQKHSVMEKYDGYNKVERSWIEYVSPRKEQYKKPVVVLVGRWTGSMGEGLAIGFEGMERATIVGSEMERLAGEMNGFSFQYQNFGYRLSTARLFHINGTPREKYVPANYVRQSSISKDEVLEKGMELMKTLIQQ